MKLKLLPKSTINGRLVNGRVEIPVVVSVLYKLLQKTSLTSNQSQIDV
jgi:hypothetical protein